MEGVYTMALAIPKLEIYYIEFNEKKASKNKKALLSTYADSISPSKLGKKILDSYVRMFMHHTISSSLTIDVIYDLWKLLQDKRFHVITSYDELNGFENAHGNRWADGRKANIFQEKQYYIRHPKLLNRHLLIEAESFYDYIEEEQKDELLDFILSHCPAKSIQIDRVEGSNIKARTRVNAVDATGGLEIEKRKGNFLSYNNPNCSPLFTPRETYLWLDNSIMRSISALSEGASLTQRYESDFTCGLTAMEAKTIGLDISKHKKYIYTIHIEC